MNGQRGDHLCVLGVAPLKREQPRSGCCGCRAPKVCHAMLWNAVLAFVSAKPRSLAGTGNAESLSGPHPPLAGFAWVLFVGIRPDKLAVALRRGLSIGILDGNRPISPPSRAS